MVYRNKMKYIYKKREHYVIIKTINSKTHIYGYYKNVNDAIQRRDWLEKQNWNIEYACKRDASKPAPNWNPQRKLQRLADEYKKASKIKHNRLVKTSV